MAGVTLLWIAVAAVLSAPALAQTPDENGPGRGVARISLINGDVSVQRGDSGDFIAAGINAPLVVQDRLITGLNSRAELQFDYSNFLRIAASAEVRLGELEHRRYILQVARGIVTWRVLRDQDAYVEISTPSVSVRPVGKGIYRIAVREDGTSEITVRSGEAEIFTPRGSERLRAGRTMAVRGDASDPEYRIVPEVEEDDWDRWNVSRDRDLRRTRSYQYMSRDIYGAEDLDNHGRWVNVPGYGWVWSPRVAPGWAPYRYGRWTWIDWYGWSWVSYDPWGWAPYHYGRWFYHGPYGWCWWPGTIRARHYWSPGIVAFFGFGRVGVGVGFGWGNIGWVPLAPYERFYPWWGRRWYGGYRRPGYFGNNVTIVNNVNIRNIYRNSRIDRGITVVDHDGFRQGRLNEAVRVVQTDLRQASVARGPLPIAPVRESLRLADREAPIRSADRGPERFFSNRRPAQVERVSFEDQRRGMERFARRTFGGDETRASSVGEGVRSAPVRSGTDSGMVRGWRSADTSTNPQPASGEQRGWRRVGEPQRGARPDASARTASSGERGAGDRSWRAFGEPRPSDSGRRGDMGIRGTGEDWGRFGEPRPADSGQRTGIGTRAAGDDWTRFGDRSARGSRSFDGSSRGDGMTRFGGSRLDREPRPEASSSDGVRGGRSSFDGGRRSEGRTGPSSDPDSWRDSGPRSERPDGGRRSDFGRSRGESIRIDPPIVQERRSFGGRSFEGSRSAPSGDRGSRFGGGSRSAPSGGFGGMRGGGGGGAVRSSGGGGGGGRSGGGGGRRGGR